MLKLGDKTISDIYLGDKKIAKVFLGDKLVYQAGKPIFLEYIIFDGESWIDTGFKPNPATTRVILENVFLDNTKIQTVFGSRPVNTVSSSSCNIWYNIDIGKLSPECLRLDWTGAIENPPLVPINQRNIIDCLGNTVTINGVKYQSTIAKTNAYIKYSMYLGNHNSAGTVYANSCKMRVYSFKIYDNGILAQDLRPCLDSKGIVCMYDMVTGKLFYNKGTGNLIAGVPSEYTRLEYLQSNSKAYINTGIAGGVDTLEVGCKFSWSKFVSYGAAYGNYISDSHNGIRLILQNADNIILANSNTICTTTGNTELNCARNAIHTVVNKYDTINVDGKVITRTNKVKGRANSGNIVLFNRSITNPNTARDIGMKIYSFYIKNNDKLVCYLVPCRRNSDNALGMYDVVRNIFLTNVGTGTFIAGGTV